MNRPMIKKVFTFQYFMGLHARVAAMVVQKAYEIQKKYGVQLYIQKQDSGKIPLSSLLILTTMKIRKGDTLTVLSSGPGAQEAVDKMVAFLSGDFRLEDDASIKRMDHLLQDNVATAEQIFKSVATGLIVINENDIVTLFNPVAERIFKIKADRVLGHRIMEAIPESGLEKVRQTCLPQIGVRQNIGHSVIVKSSTPVYGEDGDTIGAVCVFEDISNYIKISWELKEIRELKEKYQLILETMQEGICVLDEKGVINYVNPAYLKILGLAQENLIGKNIDEISPNGARSRVLHTGKMQFGCISRKENCTTIVANVHPILVDGNLLGVISVVNNITEIQNLMDMLNRTSARAEYLEGELQRTKRVLPAFRKIIGSSGSIKDAVALAAKAAKSVYTVLIRGESGTGKELFAEAIYYASPRAQEPFIRVNCAAIPSSLLESELFGHERGAFTGAVKTQLGKFELANHGTIFLDEIGDMEKDMQVKLLRFIQNKEFQRVGGEKTIHVDVRIIAATNRNLENMLKNGTFREDLYYRLNVIPIFLPPLREHREDIPLLTDAFLKKIGKELGKPVTGFYPEALQAMMRYSWPGNIRELENVMERTVTLLDGDRIRFDDLPDYIRNGKESVEVSSSAAASENEPVLRWEEYEKSIIANALRQYGSCNAAGHALGLSHKTVSSKARKYGILH